MLIFAPRLEATIKRGVWGEGRGVQHTILIAVAAKCDLQMRRSGLCFVPVNSDCKEELYICVRKAAGARGIVCY